MEFRAIQKEAEDAEIEEDDEEDEEEDDEENEIRWAPWMLDFDGEDAESEYRTTGSLWMYIHDKIIEWHMVQDYFLGAWYMEPRRFRTGGWFQTAHVYF